MDRFLTEIENMIGWATDDIKTAGDSSPDVVRIEDFRRGLVAAKTLYISCASSPPTTSKDPSNQESVIAAILPNPGPISGEEGD